MSALGTAANPLVFHADASHGWLRVPLGELSTVGLTLASFSTFSYVDHRSAYLEEDGDAGVYLKAWRAKHGGKPEYIEVDDGYSSPIRNKRSNSQGKPWSQYS